MGILRKEAHVTSRTAMDNNSTISTNNDSTLCLKSNHAKNFFLKHEKNLVDLTKGLTYEDVVNDQISGKVLTKLLKFVEKQKKTKSKQNNEKNLGIEKFFEHENLEKIIIHFPMNISTEYTSISKLGRPLNNEEYPSKLLSAQIRLASTDSTNDTLLYSPISKPHANLINYDVDFIPLQLLVDNFGFNVEVLQGRRWYDVKEKKYPTINLILYCFSGREHIFKLFTRYNIREVKLKRKLGGSGLEHILKQVKNGLIDDNKFFSFGRYKMTPQRFELPYLLIGSPLLLELDGETYKFRPKFKVSIKVIDICAIHGDASLSEIASNVDVHYDELINNEEKHNLESIYENDWERFIKYAQAKCISYDIIQKYYKLNEKIYGDLGLHSFLKQPTLTIGATVKNLLEAAVIAKVKEILPDTDEKIIKNYLKLGSAKNIFTSAIIKNLQKELPDTKKENIENFLESPTGQNAHDKLLADHDMRLLSKVIGGRTYCAQPKHICTSNDVICDSDISGAYATALAYSRMPLGTCTIVSKMRLKEYLENHHSNAKEGLELVYVTVFEDEQSESIGELPESQNFIPSFTTPKTFTEVDSDEQGETRVYTHQIFQAPFTSSTFIWLEHIATTKLKEHIINKGMVIAGAYYDKNKYRPLEDLENNLNKLNEKEEWTAVDLKPMIDTLRQMRKSNPKKNEPDGTPQTAAMNALLKLMTNNVYGVLSSSHFDIGNSIVANNVTADVRLLAWCMETALGAFQTITDGVSWCLNNVVVGKNNDQDNPLNSSHHLLHRKLAPSRQHRKKDRICHRDGGWDWAAIGEAESYNWDDEYILEYRHGKLYERYHKSDLIKKIDKPLIHEHLNKYFPSKILKDFFKRFEIESKGLYTCIVTDGTANYVLVPYWDCPDKELVIKRRSHKVKQGKVRDHFKHYYLEQLHLNPKCIKIPMPYIVFDIVSCGTYKQRYESHFQYTMLIPGDYEPKVRTFQAFNLSQFTFRSQEQYQAKKIEHEKAKNKFGLSTERYHRIVNNGEEENFLINYKEMLEDYEKAIFVRKEELRLKYHDYQNNKNYQRKYGPIQCPYPNKISQEELFREYREMFDYEPSEVKQFPQTYSDSSEEEL